MCFQEGARVALQAREFGALHSTAAETFGVGFRRQLERISKIEIHIPFAGLKPRFVCVLLKTIPGANILADVAAVKPTFKVVSHVVREFRIAQFDGELGPGVRVLAGR